jgi:hypothetical protein
MQNQLATGACKLGAGRAALATIVSEHRTEAPKLPGEPSFACAPIGRQMARKGQRILANRANSPPNASIA